MLNFQMLNLMTSYFDLKLQKMYAERTHRAETRRATEGPTSQG